MASLCCRYVGVDDDVSADANIAYNLVQNEKYLDALGVIGYYISALADLDKDDSYYSATDCIYTAKALTALFSPTILMADQRVHVHRDMNPVALADALRKYNFISVVVHELDYHRFTLVKVKGEWYLLDSYAETYALKVRSVDAHHLLSDLNAEAYTSLFGPPEFPEKEYAVLDLKFGFYDPNYGLRLLSWLEKKL